MTDAAVVADSAPAPVAQGAVINENAPVSRSRWAHSFPMQVHNRPQSLSRSRSTTASIARSAAKQACKPDPKVEAKPEPVKEPKVEQPRENSKFVAREPAKATEPAPKVVEAAKPAEPVKPNHIVEDAPARFTDTAKSKWHAVDSEIRGETLRMQRELTEAYQRRCRA